MRFLQIAMFECFNPKRCLWSSLIPMHDSFCFTDWGTRLLCTELLWQAFFLLLLPTGKKKKPGCTTLCSSAKKRTQHSDQDVGTYVCKVLFWAGKEVGMTFAPPWKSLNYFKPIQKSYNIKCMILRRLLVYETENGEDLKIDMNWRKNHCHTVYSIMIW